MEPKQLAYQILGTLEKKLRRRLESSNNLGGLTLKVIKDQFDKEAVHINYGTLGRVIMVSRTGRLVRICSAKPLDLAPLYKDDLKAAHEEVEAFLRDNGFEIEYNGEYEKYYLGK